jgi:sugar lactone lactonase YvrE
MFDGQVQLPSLREANSMVLCPNEKWLLAAQYDDNIVHVVSLNPKTGAMALSAAAIGTLHPAALVFAADGAHAVVATQRPDMLRVYAFNTSTGAVGAAPATREFPMPRTPSHITVGDFNGDGLRDFAVTATKDSDVAILLGDVDGPVSLVSPVSGCYPSESIIAKDFNHDGITDLLKVCYNSVEVYLGHGDGTFAAAVYL